MGGKLVNSISLGGKLVNVGIHASINVHEYHCIAIRMRCWLVDVFFFYSLLKCWQHICTSRIDHVHRARETNDYQQ